MNLKNRTVLAVACFALLCACSPRADKLTFPVLPEELKDCSFYEISGGYGDSMKVVRCPHSTTSANYQRGKTRESTVFIDA